MENVVPQNKISKYLLDISNVFGAAKARFFISGGFAAANPGQLAATLRQHPLEAKLKTAEPHPDGRKLCYECEIVTPNGRRVCIRSVWIEQRDRSVTRLVTAYPFL
jgi:hypothetical protein